MVISSLRMNQAQKRLFEVKIKKSNSDLLCKYCRHFRQINVIQDVYLAKLFSILADSILKAYTKV